MSITTEIKHQEQRKEVLRFDTVEQLRVSTMAVQMYGRLVARKVVLSVPREVNSQIAEKDWADARADAVYSSLLGDLGRLARGYELGDIAYREDDIDIIANSLYELAGQDTEVLTPQQLHLRELANKVSAEIDSYAIVIPMQRVEEAK
jgi:hypothetical protein